MDKIICGKAACGHWIIAHKVQTGPWITIMPLFHAEDFSDVLVILNARSEEELDKFLVNVPVSSDTYAY